MPWTFARMTGSWTSGAATALSWRRLWVDAEPFGESSWIRGWPFMPLGVVRMRSSCMSPSDGRRPLAPLAVSRTFSPGRCVISLRWFCRMCCRASAWPRWMMRPPDSRWSVRPMSSIQKVDAVRLLCPAHREVVRETSFSSTFTGGFQYRSLFEAAPPAEDSGGSRCFCGCSRRSAGTGGACGSRRPAWVDS